jgi:predicted nucleic acid-binding protein
MTSARRSYPSVVFLDSSANLAVIDSNDGQHEAAHSIREGLVASRSRLVTTNYILDESYTLIMSELGTRVALSFLRDIRRSAVTIERVSASDEQRAEEILNRYSDHTFSYTDATSFAVMERLGITAAFAFDGDFLEYHLTVIQP